MEGYSHLAEMYELHPIGAPKRPEFDEILCILFTPEEANLTRFMNFTLKKDERIAQEANIDIETAGSLLENMANKLIVFSKKKADGRYYSLLPLLPGIYEFPFMDGGGPPVMKSSRRSGHSTTMPVLDIRSEDRVFPWQGSSRSRRASP